MDSYSSKYPLEYYEVGTPYMFYLHDFTKSKAATADQVKRFAPILKTTAKNSGGGYYFAKRVIGVVVDKGVYANCSWGYIEVMFLVDYRKDEGTPSESVHLIKRYIVNYTGVFCDDKEQFEATGTVAVTGEILIDITAIKRKTGGITEDTKAKVNGGITEDKGVIVGGGITEDK